MEAQRIPWRPLGRLLVEKGLLTDETLERALQDQAVTGRRLGEILVGLGCVSHADLSLVLAEQYGFELPTGTGPGTALRRLGRPDDGEPTTPPVLALVPSPQASREPGPLHLARLEEQWAKLAAAEARVAELELELVRAKRAAERRRAQSVRLVRRLRRSGTRAEKVAEADGHILLVHLGDRYELVERDGSPPPPGALVEVPGLGDEAFVVDRLCRSPLPNDVRGCVVLHARR